MCTDAGRAIDGQQLFRPAYLAEIQPVCRARHAYTAALPTCMHACHQCMCLPQTCPHEYVHVRGSTSLTACCTTVCFKEMCMLSMSKASGRGLEYLPFLRCCDLVKGSSATELGRKDMDVIATEADLPTMRFFQEHPTV